MITPFTRAELLITYDLSRLNQARSALAAAGVDYTTVLRIWPAPRSETRGGAPVLWV